MIEIEKETPYAKDSIGERLSKFIGWFSKDPEFAENKEQAEYIQFQILDLINNPNHVLTDIQWQVVRDTLLDPHQENWDTSPRDLLVVATYLNTQK